MAGAGAGVLTLGAVVVFIGVFASILFERYRLPDVVVLLLVGILVGPVAGLVEADQLADVAAIFATLALVVILFEGGLDLNVRLLRGRLALTTMLLVGSYFATAAAVAVTVHALSDFSWQLAMLLGLVLAPLSSSILIPLLGRLRILPETRALLTVESALGDVLAVLAVFTLAGSMQEGTLDVLAAGRSLATSFLLGGALAAAAGVGWLVVLRWLKGRPYAYLVTFAMSVLLFGAVEAVEGNGVVAVLVFALVLGNASLLARRFPGLGVYKLDARIKWFHAEMSFFVRTFFFIYLGILVTLDDIGPRFLLTIGAIVAVMLLVRGALVAAVVRERPVERKDAGYLTFLMARGLASAALAGAPAVVALSKGTRFGDLAFGVILLTNLVMTGFILWKEHGFGEGAEPEAHLVEFDELAFDLDGFRRIGTGPATPP